MKRLGLMLILVTLVGCTATPTLTPPTPTPEPTPTVVVTQTPAPTPTLTPEPTALASIEKSGGYKTPVPSAGSMILKMHEFDFDFWMNGNGDYQWWCENKLCGCMFTPSVNWITCGMTYDNPYIQEFEINSVNVFLIFGVPDDAIMAVHDAQILARDVPTGEIVKVSGLVQNWGWRHTNDPNDRSLHTSFWIIQ